MNKNFIHLIISRVAVKWKQNGKYKNEEVGLTWSDWSRDSLNLYDNFCRKSLKNQSNQNFKLISLIDVDIDINQAGNRLDNEIYLYVNDYSDIINAIKKYAADLKKQYILITRIDRDDVVKYDFVENLHSNVKYYLSEDQKEAENFYFDIEGNYIYSIEKKETYNLNTYKTATSHFVSILEKNDCNFKCLAYTRHDLIRRKMKGKKYKNLQSIVVIHNHNIVNHNFLNIVNEKISIDLSDYGI